MKNFTGKIELSDEQIVVSCECGWWVTLYRVGEDRTCEKCGRVYRLKKIEIEQREPDEKPEGEA